MKKSTVALAVAMACMPSLLYAEQNHGSAAGRYTMVQLGATNSQVNLLDVSVTMNFPKRVVTVKDALEHALKRSGYNLSSNFDTDHGTKLLSTLLLPEAQREIGPINLIMLLQTLAGPAYKVEISHLTREVSFHVKDEWQKELAAIIGDTNIATADSDKSGAIVSSVEVSKKPVEQNDSGQVAQKELEEPTNNARYWIDKSAVDLRNRKWDSAIEAATQAIRLSPKSAVPYINRSWGYAEKGMFQKALADADFAIKVLPNNAIAFNNRAYAYELAGNLLQAQTDYRQACDLNYKPACDSTLKMGSLTAAQVNALSSSSLSKMPANHDRLPQYQKVSINSELYPGIDVVEESQDVVTAVEIPPSPFVKEIKETEVKEEKTVNTTTSKPKKMFVGKTILHEYGPINSNETLFEVARKVRPSEKYSVPQVVVALFNKNPDAFKDSNMNNLLQGSTLVVPSEEEIQANGRKSAWNEVVAQYDDWKTLHLSSNQ